MPTGAIPTGSPTNFGGRGVYNLGGGEFRRCGDRTRPAYGPQPGGGHVAKINPIPMLRPGDPGFLGRQILPLGEATKQRQAITGRVLPGEINWGEEGGRDRGEGGSFNILDLLKGMFSGLFGGGRGETSQEYRQPLSGYGRTPSVTTPSRPSSTISTVGE